MASQQKKIQHLYLRAGFGETPSFISKHLHSSIPDLVDALFLASASYHPLNYLKDPVHDRDVSNFRVLAMILRSREQMQKLNLAWLDRMASTRAAFREKMTFFWHNHFATSTPLAWLMQVQNNTLRKHATGSFRKLLHAVAKDPAMLLYLNNHENKKGHPNENFAREVMELFTLGIGHYTEKDIRESARAFTGWTVSRRGEFSYDVSQHDDGVKEFLGRSGNFGGEDILDILLEEKQTAMHVVSKIYRQFVNEEPDTEMISSLAGSFYYSDYDIAKMMRGIITSDWFYDDKNIGCKIASPVELLVRYKKLVHAEVKDERGFLGVQKVLGQVLFFPPNVAGWPGGNSWIDSSSLLVRLGIPAAIISGGGFDLRPKPEPEDAPDPAMKTNRKLPVTADWSEVVDSFRRTDPTALDDALIEALVQCPDNRVDRNVLARYSDDSSPENRIISKAGILMSMPEFQLI